MPSPTYVALAKTVLTGTQASVSFSSISSAYTDLVLVYSARTNEAGNYNDTKITFNGSTSAVYSATLLYADTTTAGSLRDSGASNLGRNYINGNNATANTFASGELYFPNYAGSTNKVIGATSVTENNTSTNGTTLTAATAGLWRDTSAINSITIAAQGSTLFVSGSRFDLYGIKNS